MTDRQRPAATLGHLPADRRRCLAIVWGVRMTGALQGAKAVGVRPLAGEFSRATMRLDGLITLVVPQRT